MNTPLGQSVSRQMDSCGDQAKDPEDFNILTTSCVRALHLLFQSFSAPDCGLSHSGVSNSSRLMDCSSPGSSVRGDSPGKNTRGGCHFLLHISCISCIGWVILLPLSATREALTQLCRLSLFTSGWPRRHSHYQSLLATKIPLKVRLPAHTGWYHIYLMLYSQGAPGVPHTGLHLNMNC